MDKSPISAFFAMVAVAAAFSAGPASGDILPPPKGGYFAANSRQTGTRRPSPVAHPALPSPAEDKPENPLETLFEGRTPRKAERDALHPSLRLAAFRPVCCFVSDDGAIAGRVDALPMHRIADWDPDKADSKGNFDDPLALFRVTIYDAPIRPLQKPKTVFYATRRVEGTSGTHSFVDVTWWHALQVAVSPKVPAGKANAEWEPSDGADVSIELKRYSDASPETGLTDETRKCRLVRWTDLLRPAAAPEDADF